MTDIRNARLDRRTLLTSAGTWLLASSAAGPVLAAAKPLARLAIVTDIHYADKATQGTRRYRDSFDKLAEAVTLWDKQSVDAVIEIGDLVDASPSVEMELRDLQRIRGVFRKLAVPQYFALGNHCVLTLTKQQFLNAWGADASWYSFQLPGYRCIVLDSAFTSDGQPYGGRAFDWKDSFIPPAQLDWLKKELDASKLATVIFIHHRLDVSEHYTVSNAPAIRKLLETSSHVTAVFQGHNHVNDHQVIGGIHYCSLKAMVDGPPPENSAYGVLEFFPDGALHLSGYRLLVSRDLPGGRHG